MADRDGVREALVEELSLAAKVDLAALSDGAAIREEVPVDSLALLDVLLRVEKRLGVEIDDEALGRVRTVGDLVDCIAASPRAEGA
jgi:acyl carrier protein